MGEVIDFFNYKVNKEIYHPTEEEQTVCSSPFHANIYVKRTHYNFLCTNCMEEVVFAIHPSLPNGRWYEIGENSD